MILRLANEDDLDSIGELAILTQGAPHWTREQYALLLDGPGPEPTGILALATQNDVLIGFIAGHSLLGEAEIESIVVDLNHRRQGIARQLIVFFQTVSNASILRLEVRESNLAAIALYSTAGFVQNGRRPDYYSHPSEDAILMQRGS